MADVHIGTSGWTYDTWADDFYEGVPKKKWLDYYAECFDTAEVNASFYRLQSESTLEKWKDRTPGGFRFALKGHRFVTHNKKLLDPDDPVQRSRDNAQPLGAKLGAMIWQLPEVVKCDVERLETFAAALNRRWSAVRHAIEFRHRSWFEDDVAARMEDHDLAVCMSDAADWPMWKEVTTDMVYVRLHGHTRTYASAYSDSLLEDWASDIEQWTSEGRDVWVFFDNDSEGAAPHDALRLKEMVGA